MTDKIMAGKRGLVMGVANKNSIAWGITKALADQGAEIAFTYQGEALKKRVEPLVQSVGSDFMLECDVTNMDSLDAVFTQLAQKWEKIDFIVHAIAYSDKNELARDYLSTSRQNFLNTMDISCYSLTAVCQRAEKIMNPGGAILTLTYYGAERVMPHYNVMGVAKAALEASVRYLAVDMGKHNIRVNAISAGPIKTLAAVGIGQFRKILKWNELNSPLGRTVSIEDVGGSGLYLLSHLGSGVTGEIHHVDAGYNIVGMLNPDQAEGCIEVLKK